MAADPLPSAVMAGRWGPTDHRFFGISCHGLARRALIGVGPDFFVPSEACRSNSLLDWVSRWKVTKVAWAGDGTAREELASENSREDGKTRLACARHRISSERLSFRREITAGVIWGIVPRFPRQQTVLQRVLQCAKQQHAQRKSNNTHQCETNQVNSLSL